MGWADLALSVAADRVRRRWSIRELAERAGVSVRTIEYVESGERSNYSEATLTAVESALHWPVGAVARLVETGSAPMADDPDLAAVLALWPLLTLRDRRALALLAEHFQSG